MSARQVFTVKGHEIEGEVVYTRTGGETYNVEVTNGRFLCGPHDANGNHVAEPEGGE